MSKKNNLGRAIIKDRFKSGRKKSGGSFVSDSSHVACCLSQFCVCYSRWHLPVSVDAG